MLLYFNISQEAFNELVIKANHLYFPKEKKNNYFKHIKTILIYLYIGGMRKPTIDNDILLSEGY